MRKVGIFVLIMAFCSCESFRHYNPSGQTSRYIAVTSDGDSIEIGADSWEWDNGSVYFYSKDGDQYVRYVKHIILKE